MTDTQTDSVPATPRPERKSRTLRSGDVVREAHDCRFVSSPSRTVHERAECDHADYEYDYHPKCGQRLPDGSLWSRVSADSREEAVLDYNLVPCTKCFPNSLQLERWRKALHSSHVMHGVEPPEKWQEKYG